MFNKNSKFDIGPVMAAFTQEKETILIISASLQYKLTWAKKKIDKCEKIEDPSKTKLTGASFEVKEFNAALAYTKYNKKQGLQWPEVWRFDQKIAHSVKVYAGDDPGKGGWITIKDFFNIDGWCPAS